VTYTRILVPHDGSKYSDKALGYAVKIAKASGASITLFNVVEEIPIPPMIQSPRIRSPKTDEETSIETYLKELYQDMKNSMTKTLGMKKAEHEKSGVSIEVKVVVGYPSDKIIEHTKEEKVDLVVMGTRGLRGALGVAVLGSVARKVSERATCPAILVH
jgi:nucleotide-binding universal stress UspA family protein